MATTEKASRKVFPFTAIVGQEEMKLAMVLNVIDPRIGGVMVMGDRGTGKSTAVRAIIDVLPQIDVVAGDPFNSSPSDTELMSDPVRKSLEDGENIETEAVDVPLVDLPLGATEDRVCGAIDIERALAEGVKAFEPGLLAKANRGILYVDEVNLLDDHLVDVLLDSAASGWNTVEREGISIKHPARFVLVGSGNPEEGELRPQLLDRFGMYAEVKTAKDTDARVAVVENRRLFEEDPQGYVATQQVGLDELKGIIAKAQTELSNVQLSDAFRRQISEMCGQLDIDGLRGDIVTNRAARAHAAYQGRNEVTAGDIEKVATLCLSHRLRSDPTGQTDSRKKVETIFAEVFDPDA
jgi:magnesium chelatase subunit I